MEKQSRIDVRRISADDGPLLRSLRLEMLADTPSAFGSTLEAERRRPAGQWAAAAAERSTGQTEAMFLASHADEVIGIVGCHLPDPAQPVLDLVSMWVRAEHRGGPAARLLVEEVLAFAEAKGFNHIELWVTRGNDRAQRFYERMGFELTGATAPLPSDPCKDEQRMRRSITGRLTSG